MPVTMTLDFEGTRVTLSPSETQAVLHHVSELRRRLEFGDDTEQERVALQEAVRRCIAAHTRVAPDEIAVAVSEDGSGILPRRARPAGA
ncbi:MAG: hypothetical protein JOZ75_06020 [Candidatus Dormibacteraeota bacterium]|nr:hypothetical protein [Candidatus Dormibacteraeota bacterium]